MSKYSYEFKKKIVLEYLAGEGGPVTLARKYGSTFYVYLDSGKINDGKNSYEGGINESIFRGKIAQWGVTFDDVNLKKVKPWEEIL